MMCNNGYSYKQCGLVGIVIPVFNEEKYLRECLESVLNQTYEHFCVVLVDDGSIDGSGRICDEFASLDNRIDVYHTANKGISAARNFGLSKLPDVDYVCFVDSDDVVAANYLETMLMIIGDADCLICNIDVIAGDKYLVAAANEENIVNEAVLSPDAILESYMHGGLGEKVQGPYAKLYKWSIVENMRFNVSLAVAEDIVFNLNVYAVCRSLILSSFAGYYYRRHYASTTNRIDRKYSLLYEHDYTIIRDAIFTAQRELGLPCDELRMKQVRDFPMRCFHELLNLFLPGSPYRGACLRAKIREVISDQNYRKFVNELSINELGNAEKIAFICVKIGSAMIAETIFRMYSYMRSK